MAPRACLSFALSLTSDPLGPWKPQPLQFPHAGVSRCPVETQTVTAAPSIWGGGVLSSPSPARALVILTLAVSEVQSLVPLRTLQLAIFNHWGG